MCYEVVLESGLDSAFEGGLDSVLEGVKLCIR